MENHIAFKQGDIVCRKSAFTPRVFVELIPYRIDRIYPDNKWEERAGTPGGGNEYQLVSLISSNLKYAYQYELQLWSDVKEQVVKANEEYVALLKGI